MPKKKTKRKGAKVALRAPVKSVSAGVGEILVRAFGKGADRIGDYFSERLEAFLWQTENLAGIADKKDEEVARRGLNPSDLNPLPEGDAYRAFDAASQEDNEDVQKLWAGLLTSAMDPKNPTTASKVFVELLRSIGPAEAGLLSVIREINQPLPRPKEKTNQAYQKIRTEALTRIEAVAKERWRSFPPGARANAIQNLMRLRCIGYRTGKQMTTNNLLGTHNFAFQRSTIVAKAEEVARALSYVEDLALAASGTGELRPARGVLPEMLYEFTSLGRSLMKACMPNDNLLDADVSEVSEVTNG